MAKNSKLRVLNILSGSKFGGAELFFERLAIAFEKTKNIDQKIVVKKDEKRVNRLKEKIKDINQISLFKSYNFFISLELKKIIIDFNPDIVLTWMNRASNILPTSKLMNEVTVGRLGGYYKIKNYAKCDYLITNTLDLKEYVISLGWDPKNVEFIPNFVSENRIKQKNLFDNKTLLCMGRFHENKSIDTLIRAMTFLSSYSLVIVGSGPLKELYESLINKFNLRDRVKIFGWSENISEFINSSSILVCPSRHEPFGNVVIDGWAHKIPVVVSNVGGPGKIINHKRNGIKFEKENVFDLVSKIKEISTDSKLKNSVVKNGYEDFKKNYSERVVVEKYVNFFERIKKKCVE